MAEEPERTDVLDRLKLLETIVGHAGDAIVVTELDARVGEPRIVFVNPAFTAQSGYAPDEVVGKHPRILVGPRSDLTAQLQLRNAVGLLEPTTVELIHYRKDGSLYWVENSITPVADEDGRFTHVISIQRDVTERKQAEEAATTGGP